MHVILQLFIRHGGFFVFALLEVISAYLIVNFNGEQGKIYAHTSSLVGGRVSREWHKLTQFADSPRRLREVMEENDSLKTLLLRRQTVRLPYRDTFFLVSFDTLKNKINRPAYEFIAAQVIGNSIGGSSNWIMLNRGRSDGVTDNSGVVSRQGLVGVVRFTDEHFALAMSLLHRQTRISASIKNRGYFGSLIWEGGSPDFMTLNDIPKHVEVNQGDTIVTSGYSLMFPQDQLIGFVESHTTPSGSNFHAIQVRLSQPMADVHDVYVVKNIFYTQIDSLQRRAKDE